MKHNVFTKKKKKRILMGIKDYFNGVIEHLIFTILNAYKSGLYSHNA